MDDTKQNFIALVNGIIVIENDILTEHVLILEEAIIKYIIPANKFISTSDFQIHDMKGKYIIPGIIDIHSDIIENVISPRRDVVFNPYLALTIVDKMLISFGITTIYHSLSFANTTICGKNRTLDTFQMERIGRSIHSNKDKFIINHRLHIRFEINCCEALDSIYKMIHDGIVDELSLMDHTPGQGQYRDLDIFKKEIKKQYGEVTKIQEEEIINKCLKKIIGVSEIEELVKIANRKNIPIAYHDVENLSQILFMQKNNIKICEFPINIGIAQKSKELGLDILVGAPNILLGGSHNNNISAETLINDDIANIICSDYFPGGILSAIFSLHNTLNKPLYELVRLITINPAKAVGIDENYGSIKEGKKANLVIVDNESSIPSVTGVYIEGKCVLNF